MHETFLSPAILAIMAASEKSSPRGLRLFNYVGGLLAKLGARGASLEESSLLQAAARKAKLKDFGDDSFHEPFRKLLHSYDNESHLTPFGRLLARLNLKLLLVNRLRVEELIKQHPEILEIPIRHPFIIAGLPRTGTSLLYNLMAQDPANRPLLFWESLAPAPINGKVSHKRDPRIRQAQIIVRLIKKLSPKLMSIHPIGALEPEECSRLQMNTFVTPFAAMENNIPSYLDWYLQLSPERLALAYQDYHRQLKVLDWQRPASEQWVLKSPSHLLSLTALQRVFPDVRLIQTHRDPHKVIPSACSLLVNYQGMSSDQVNPKVVGQQILNLCGEGARRSLEYRQTEPGGNTFHMLYKELIADPIGMLRRIYTHFGSSLSPAAEANASRWVKENPANKHGEHRYALDDFGLTPQDIDRTFATYVETFQIPRESKP